MERNMYRVPVTVFVTVDAGNALDAADKAAAVVERSIDDAYSPAASVEVIPVEL